MKNMSFKIYSVVGPKFSTISNFLQILKKSWQSLKRFNLIGHSGIASFDQNKEGGNVETNAYLNRNYASTCKQHKQLSKKHTT